MGVTDLEQVRVERLVPTIVAELRARGVALAAVSTMDDVARWRRAARLAGRQLGWHVRTGVSSESVWAASEDWEAPPGADRDAAVRVAALFADPGWLPSVPTYQRARESVRRTGGSITDLNDD
jgi:hypothetical protein